LFMEQILVHRASNTPLFIEVFAVRTPCSSPREKLTDLP
jgi:hypothetical protein